MPFNTAVVSSSGGGGGSSTLGAVYNATAPTLTDGATTNLQTDVNGNLKTNPGFYNTNTHTHTSVTGTTSSATALVANPARTSLSIQNQDSANSVWVNLAGGTAAANGTCIKIAAGGVYEPPVTPTTAITIICTTGSPVCCFTQSS